MAVEGSVYTLMAGGKRDTAMETALGQGTGARAFGRGDSDGAGREQGRAQLGLTAAVAQVGQGKKRRSEGEWSLPFSFL